MKLSANVMFLSWTAFLGLFGVATSSPGILARCSIEGLQAAADVALKTLNGRMNEGMHVPDQRGSFSPVAGTVDYILTEIEVTKCSMDQLKVRIIPGTGVTFSIDKMEMTIRGKFSYRYTLFYIPTLNSGTFSLTTSDASVSLEVTARMSPDGLPIVDILSCSASVENIGLTFVANIANWLLKLFNGRIKEKVKPTLETSICDGIKNERNLIAEELAKHVKPCLDKECKYRIDLRFVSPPVYGENFIETSHRGEIFWKNDTGMAPYEASPFQPLPPSSKMVDLYFSAYVLNTALYALHQHDLLSYYRFTKYDLPDACQNVLDTSCENNSLCIGNILKIDFASFPNASIELAFVTSRPSFVSISNDSLSVTFDIYANLSIRNSDGSMLLVKLLFLGGYLVGSPFINPDALIDFTATNVKFANASIRDAETESDFFKSIDSDAIGRLQIIAKECVLPKLIARESSHSVTYIGGFHTTNRSLELIKNALLFTSDGFYSNGI